MVNRKTMVCAFALSIGAAVLAGSAVSARAESYWYGVGALPCSWFMDVVAKKDEASAWHVVMYLQGALSVVGIMRDAPIFPATLRVDQRVQYLMTSVRLRCGRHPEWSLGTVVEDIAARIGEPETHSLFEPPAGPKTLFQ